MVIINKVLSGFIVFFFLPLIFLLLINTSILEEKIDTKINIIKEKNEIIENYKEDIKNYQFTINNSIIMERKYRKTVNYMYGEATAYHPSSGGINSDSDPTITSIGLKAEVGIIAVNPKMIPYGSQVMIISGNTVVRGIAGDTGGAMRQNPKQVDILMGTREEALKWGHKKGVHIIWWEE